MQKIRFCLEWVDKDERFEKLTFQMLALSRSDEGLTIQISAFQIFHDGNSIFINSFDKTKFVHSPTDTAPQFV